MIKRGTGIVALAVALIVLSSTASAATPATPPLPAGGLSIAPAMQDRALGPTEKSANFSVQISNETDKPIRFALSSNDFTALNQTGGLTFLGTDVNRVTKGHGLSSILQFDAPQINVAAHSSQIVTAHVPDVSKLATGGHYAAIVAQALPDGSGSVGNRVTINQAVSSLIFLETAGQGSKTLSLLKPVLPNLTFSLPDTVNVVFKATGNTQTVPRGLVRTFHGNSEQQRGLINENSSLILPESARLLPIQLQGNRHPLWPGVYTLRVQYRYEGSLGISSYEKQFVYVNIWALAALLLGGLAVLYGVYKSRFLLHRAYRKLPPQNEPTQPANSSDIGHKTVKITVTDISKK